MASETQVKTYVAYWFQLGKKLVWNNGKAELLPEKVIQGDRFTSQFEDCWQKVMSVEGRDCYLVGGEATIQELLSSAWTIDQCARCAMPVPIVEVGTQPLDCACSDLDNWPNTELPAPRSPVSSQAQLNNISQRLKTKK
ncbi:MAG TPA: hypothetical protein V6C71_03670 [Coleofasciculaceae cyanobacterium]|jgi:hypothetical protein